MAAALGTKKAVEELISYTIVTDKASLVALLKSYGILLSEKPTDAEVTTAVLVANKKSKGFSKALAALLSKKLPKAGETFSNIVGNSQDFGFTGVDDVTYMKGFMGFTGWDDYDSFTGVDDFGDFLGLGNREKRTARRSTRQARRLAKRTESRSLLDASIPQSSTPSIDEISGLKTGTTTTSTAPKTGTALGNIWSFIKTNVLTPENVNAGIQVGLNKINADSLARQNAVEEQSLMLQQQQSAMRGKVGVGLSGNTLLYVGIGVVALVAVIFVVTRKK